jgi:hypothetical protein
LDTDNLTTSALVGELHEGLRENFEAAVEYFWTIFLINPLIAIKAYWETDLLIGKVDIYGTFKIISPIDVYSNQLREEPSGIYNTSVEYFLIFAIEALFQKNMDFYVHARVYLMGLYNHDKNIMQQKNKLLEEGIPLPAKWLNHRNLKHILQGIDPHHIIELLMFFADKYGARLYNGNVVKGCYSGDKYDYIIRFIKHRYGSLSEYIDWDNHMYVDYYLRSLSFEEMFSNMDVIFPTIEDKKRIEQLSGVEISDANYQRVRKENRAKNQPRIRRKK